MDSQQAQIALVIVKATWASLSPEVQAKVRAFVLEQVKDLARAELHAFFASLALNSGDPTPEARNDGSPG